MNSKLHKWKVLSVSKALRVLINSSLLLILIPMIGTILLAVNSVYTVARESEKLSQLAFSNAIAEVEWMLSSSNRINYKMCLDDSIISYLRTGERDAINEYAIRMNMTNTILGDNYVKNAFYLLPNSGIVIGINHVITIDRMVKLSYGNDTDNFISFIQNTDLPILRIFQNSQGDVYVFEVRTISTYGHDAYAVTELNIESLADNIGSLLPQDTDEFEVRNTQGILLSTIPGRSAWNLPMEKSESETKWTIWDENYSVKSHLLSESGRQYTYLTVTEELTSQADTKRFAAITIILCLFVAVLATFYVIHLNYRPIRKLMALSSPGIKNTNRLGEFDVIEKSILRYIDDNKLLVKKVSDGEKKLRGLYLENILLGRIPDMENAVETFSLYDIEFIYPCYIVLLVQQTENESLLRMEKDENVGMDCASVVDGILTNYFIQNQLNVNHYVCEIGGDTVAILNGEHESLDGIYNRIIPMITNSIKEMLHISNTASLSNIYRKIKFLPRAYNEVTHKVTESVDHMLTEKVQENADIVQLAIGIIRENYKDSSLGVGIIAERLSISPSYLSRFFKRQVGVGLLEYLHRFRIMSAKKMLADHKNMSLNDIAIEVGFYNVAALIRVFKKIEGITPGAYREHYTGNQ